MGYGNFRRLGFTLTELAIVMGVMGVVLGGIWVGAGHVNRQMSVNKASQQIVSLAYGVREVYGQRQSFGSGTTGRDISEALIAGGVVPAEMVDPSASTQLINSWSGRVYVYARDNGDFRIRYANVPKKVCAELAAMLAGNGGSSMPTVVLSNNSSSQYDLTNGGAANFDAAKAVTLCGTGNTAGDVEFQFNLMK